MALSDRPPLQTGLYLSQRRFFVHELPYTVVSVVVQSLWITSLFLLLRAFRIDPRAVGLILIVCLLNGFVFLNNFIPGRNCSRLHMSLVSRRSSFHRTSSRLPAVDGPLLPLAEQCSSLGMLSHGGSMFAIAGAAFAYLLLRRSLDLKLWSIILASAFLLYLPWMFYQKLYEPPGDRLLKYHLAGVEPLDARSFGQVVAQAYGTLTLRDWATGRMRI